MHGTMKPQKYKWRLRKTRGRRLEFRPIEASDVKYAWAGYKKGALKDMAGPLADESLTAEQFNETFQELVVTRYHSAWTLFAETGRGFLPVGMVFAFLSHAELSPFMIVGDMVWFPWASPRNKIESAVNFFEIIRHSIPMMEYAQNDTNKRFFEMLCQHSVMRRVGTTFNVTKGEAVAVYETRTG